MKEFLQQVWDFLKVHDFPTFLAAIKQLQLLDMLASPLVWLIGLPILAALILTKRFKLLLGIASVVAFLILLQYSLPPSGEQIALKDLLTFLGGTFAIVALNLYFLLIRE